ncbi:membrane dipeptidase-domain-containing protein [Aspergillus novoparasiticus]|uniref:Dipeptidase n=1 Tax=Aspergillus novoparasiticus TaxID=986946 RepID=A0A5N6F6S3_9EURO|nr:membrane dipeptidase-domain-containing protein [Aspergillus novoparasiticus]
MAMDRKGDLEWVPPRPEPLHRRNRQRSLAYSVTLTLVALFFTFTLRPEVFPSFLVRKNLQKSPLEQVLTRVPLTDGHNDFAIWTRAFYQNHIYQANFTDHDELYGQVDFPRLRKGRLGAQFWSVYVECARNPNEPGAQYEIVRDTFQQIDLVHRMIDHFPDFLVPASSVADVHHNFYHSPRRISSLLGIEGLHQLGGSASVLRMYHELGVRYASLTHTCHNEYADSEAPAEAQHGGLSAAGETIIAEMNRVGMMVDLSHTSLATQRAVFNVTRAPVMYSHSSAYALCPHSRNVPDDLLQVLKENDGIIMISLYPEYTNCQDADAASLADVADHIQYVGNLIGYRHVGLGSDFDGMSRGPKGLEDVSKYPDLIQELLDRGVSVDDLVGVTGGNVLRVLGVVEHVARSLVGMLPLEDDVKPFFE